LFVLIVFISWANAEPVTNTATDETELKLYLSYVIDLRQGGIKGVLNDPYLGYVSVLGTEGRYTGFIKGRWTWYDFEFVFSLLKEIGYSNYWHLNERGVFQSTQTVETYQYQYQYSPSVYLKYDLGYFYAAIGIMNVETSKGRLFRLSDVFFVEKKFEDINAIDYEKYSVGPVETLNLGYANDIFYIDLKILPDLRELFGHWNGFYGRVGMNLNDFEFFIYGSYGAKFHDLNDQIVSINYLGLNTSLKINKFLSIYLETRTKNTVYWPIFLETVFGVKFLESNEYSVTLENFYSTGNIYKVFIEGEKKNVLGWESWDANVAILYSPSEFNNFKTFFTMRKNWSKNWLSEFRYGYESMGNHMIDVSVRFYDL
jgi:hypothetical protein